MSCVLHEFVPHHKVKQKEDHDIDSEEYRILIAALVEVVEYGEI